jgi:hypothetical protein
MYAFAPYAEKTTKNRACQNGNWVEMLPQSGLYGKKNFNALDSYNACSPCPDSAHHPLSAAAAPTIR